MKIMQLVGGLTVGGVQRFALDLSQELGKSEEVLLVSGLGEACDQISVPSPSFRRIALGRRGGFSPKLFWQISRLIAREKPDIVHTHMRPLIYTLPALMFHPEPVYVHTIHNVADHEMNEIDFFKRRLYGRKVKAVAISEQVRQSVLDYYGTFDPPLINNGAVIHEPDDAQLAEARERLHQVKKNPGTRLLINVAHISDSKNQKMLNRAAGELAAEGYDLAVVILGKIGDQNYYREMMAEKSDNVFCFGQVDCPSAYLHQADFFTLPSKYEGLPISLLEAMGCGCIPIGTPAGGVANVIKNEENGFLTPSFELEEYKSAIRKALNLDSAAKAQMRSRAIQDYNQAYSMARCAQNYLTLYREYLQKKSGK